MKRKYLIVLLLIGAAAGILLANGCGTTYPRRDPLGEAFPTVVGQSLDKQTRQLPDDWMGEPVVVFVGYEQNTQFDIDRWLLGMQQAEIKAKVYEVPTIPGLVPGLIAGSIDDGMRSGIPSEDWAIVITVYDDADRIARFTGNENGLPARVLLLDSMGRVVFFHDRGYSVASLNRLKEALSKIKK